MHLYEDTARFYDLDPRDVVRADIPFYVEYAQAAGGPVLDLGCGTGRVSIPLAQAGCEVYGLDHSWPMLTHFAKKRAGLPPQVNVLLQPEYGDMTDFSFDTLFSLILIPFRSFQLLTGQGMAARCLACVRRHLAPGGTFIVNAYRPHQPMDENWCSEEVLQWEAEDPQTGAVVRRYCGGRRIDTKRQVTYPHYRYLSTAPDGDTQEFFEEFEMAYYHQPQLRALLEAGGFSVRETYGWYDKSPPSDGREMIFVCEGR